MMLTKLSNLLLILVVLIPFLVKSQTYLGVNEFVGSNISKSEIIALTDRLRLELFNTGKFSVIEREMMNEILTEQGFQQTGCVSNECMVEIGKLIGVQQIVGGTISKVGETYSVSARIVSVETGEI